MCQQSQEQIHCWETQARHATGLLLRLVWDPGGLSTSGAPLARPQCVAALGSKAGASGLAWRPAAGHGCFALCNVALVTLAPFPPHGFSEAPAAPPPPCALALAARKGPAGESSRPRAHVTPPPRSAVCSRPRQDALARGPQAPGPPRAAASRPAAGSGLHPGRVRGSQGVRCVWAG